MLRSVAASVVALGLAFAPVLVLAESSAGDRSPTQQAKTYAEEGREAYWAGEYQRAIEAFTRAYDLAPDPNLLFNISAAHEKLGDYRSALEYLDRYEAVAPQVEAASIAARRTALEKKLAETAEEPEAVEEPEEPEEVEQTGEPEEAEGPPPPEVPPPDPQPPVEPPPDKPVMGAAGWTLVGVGAVGLALGIGFGVASLTASRRGRDQCFDDTGPLRCPTSAGDTLGAARRNAIVADVGFAVAVLSAVAIATLVGVRLRARSKGRARAPGGRQHARHGRPALVTF